MAMTLTEIRAALDSNGLRPLKQLGQNFLHDRNLIEWLAAQAVAGLVPGSAVVEIGPGLGALTGGLLAGGMRVDALEKDRGMAIFLRERFRAEIAAGRLFLHEGDALELLPAVAGGGQVVCGNLPYYISTPLLMECMRLPKVPPRLFFLLQKEVGQRLAAPPGSKIYGALSILVQVGFKVTVVRSIPGSVFYPPPDVESAAVELLPLKNPLVNRNDFPRFARVVQRGFSQRRKKLSNLLPTGDERRAEHLSPSQWVELWRQVEQEGNADWA